MAVNMHIDGPSTARPILYHVSGDVLPAGCMLQPYAIARECREALRLVGRARDIGLDAVVDLIASDGWRLLPDREPNRSEMILLEAEFEWVRGELAPALPSRLGAVFAWETLSLATRYRETFHPHGVMHRCRIDSGRSMTRDAALIVGAFETADLVKPTLQDLQVVEDRASRYWRGSLPMEFPEVLVDGVVVVETVVDPREEIPLPPS